MAHLAIEGQLEASVAGFCAKPRQSTHTHTYWNGLGDVRMTQTPLLHATPLAPRIAVQSTPPAPTHPPHDSMFSFVSTHSNVAFSPGIGHLVYLGSSQGTSRRTRRDRPEAAIVFAVTARRDPGHVSHRESYGWRGRNTHGMHHWVPGCRTRRRCGCSQSSYRQIGTRGQSLGRTGMRRMMSHLCCPRRFPSSSCSNQSHRRSIPTTYIRTS